MGKALRIRDGNPSTRQAIDEFRTEVMTDERLGWLPMRRLDSGLL
jgi:hypothetical protein